ncbi:cytochrome oxidase Cu insertion factor (SCO1/SenC/PrrC family) [Peribacillus simplex]|nr:cytochrome oxidase Cu insertion factor (SCO1/SenC/PrrC family) [Peribacillus simplex]
MKVVFLSIIGYSYHNERNGGFNMTVKIGEKAPDFQLPANNGEMVSLSDFTGKYIVFIFLSKRHDARMHDGGL